MRRTLLSSVVASLFVAAPAFAQSNDDPMRFDGSATIGYLNNNNSAFDRATLDLYQDLGNGVLSNVGVRGRNSRSWFDAYGENFGRDDQFMYIRGGMYGVYKAGAYLNDIPHTFSSNAYTPYAGVGGNTLTATFPLGALPTAALPQAPGTWNQFRLGYDRRDFGGYVEWQQQTPWYFRADANQVTFDGTKVGSAANGTSPGNGFVDLAFPTQYTTNNWGAEAGYQSSKATFSIRWDYSKFENDNKILSWTNPFFGGNQLDASYLPPDNEFNKFTISGNYRDLPWNSVISARYTWAKTTSDTTLATTALNTGGTFAPTLPQEGSFNGEHVNQSLALSWTARPATNWDTRVYYYWTKLQNKSDVVEYGNAPTNPLPSGLGCATAPGPVPPATVPGNCEGEKFDYDKSNLGVDAWWKFARGNRLGFGYDYTDYNYERIDYSDSKVSRLWAEYKNTMLDNLSARLKYQYINRDSNSRFSTDGISPNDPAYLNAFTSAFDLQSSTTNQVKLYLDWTPMPTLGVSFEANWSNQDYDQVTYGRTKVDRQGYFASLNWAAMPTLRVNGFASWEEFKYPSNHRYIGTIAGGPTPPSGFCTTGEPELLRPQRAAVPGLAGLDDRVVQLELGDQGPDLDGRPRRRLAGDGRAPDQRLVPVRQEQGQRDVRHPGRHRPQQPAGAADRQLRQQHAAVLQHQGHLELQQELVVQRRLLVRQVQPRRHRHQRLPVHAAVPGVATNTGLSYLNGYDAYTDGHSNMFYGFVTYRFGR
jgi:hypothetical protein